MSSMVRAVVVVCSMLATVVLAAAVGVWAQAAPPPDEEMLKKRAAETGLKAGDVLNKDNWQLAEGLLPPEILKHYQKNEYVNRIVEWPTGTTKRDQEFLDASEHNPGRFAVDARATIIDKAPG